MKTKKVYAISAIKKSVVHKPRQWYVALFLWFYGCLIMICNMENSYARFSTTKMFWYAAYEKYHTSAATFSSLKEGKTVWRIYSFLVSSFGPGRYLLWSHVQPENRLTPRTAVHFHLLKTAFLVRLVLRKLISSRTAVFTRLSYVTFTNMWTHRDYNILQSLRN